MSGDYHSFRRVVINGSGNWVLPTCFGWHLSDRVHMELFSKVIHLLLLPISWLHQFKIKVISLWCSQMRCFLIGPFKRRQVATLCRPADCVRHHLSRHAKIGDLQREKVTIWNTFVFYFVTKACVYTTQTLLTFVLCCMQRQGEINSISQFCTCLYFTPMSLHHIGLLSGWYQAIVSEWNNQLAILKPLNRYNPLTTSNKSLRANDADLADVISFHNNNAQ